MRMPAGAACAQTKAEANFVASVRLGLMVAVCSMIDTLGRVFEQGNPQFGRLQG